jgi:hypothetical protein
MKKKKLRKLIEKRIEGMVNDRQGTGDLTDYDHGHWEGSMQTLQFIAALLQDHTDWVLDMLSLRNRLDRLEKRK